MIEPSQEDVLLALKGGRERIEAGWCQRHSVWQEGEQIQYCAIGAIEAGWQSSSLVAGSAAIIALNHACSARYGQGIIQYNDSPFTTQSSILALYDTAINRIQKENQT